MSTAPAASVLDAILGLKLGPGGQEAANRFALEGVTLGPGPEGALEARIRRAEATSLRIASGPYVLEVGKLALDGLVAHVRLAAGKPSLSVLEATGAEFTGVKVHGPLEGSAGLQLPAGSWSLAPLAAADGTIRAEIVDAALLFDADVTVPLRHGRIDFNDATVEHVGPDSRMGVSRLGLYVDAPNGRSYLYQFPSTPVAGVEYERRGAMLGPWVSARGSLRLQEFGEGLLGQAPAGHGVGFTDQARLLFDRTAVSGHVQLGEGKFAAPGVQAELVGRAEGRNAVRVHSEAVGRGLTLELASLSVRRAAVAAKGAQLASEEVTGTLALRLARDRAQLRFAFDLASLKLSGLRLRFDDSPAG